MRGLNLSTTAVSDYISTQRELREEHILLAFDWIATLLSRTYVKSDMSIPIFFKAVEIVNRFLSKKSIGRTMLQLLSTTAMWISIKIHSEYDSKIPCTGNLVRYCSNKYRDDEFIRMEMIVLKTLDHKLCTPTLLTYHCVLSVSSSSTHDVITRYLMMRSVFEYDMLIYSPYEIATACGHVAHHVIDNTPVLSSDCIEHVIDISTHKLVGCNGLLNIFNADERKIITSFLH